MSLNKLFSTLSSALLIIYCVAFRQKLPAIYMVECLILFKSSIDVKFGSNLNDRNFKNLEEQTLKQKLSQIRASYYTHSYVRTFIYFIIVVNLTAILIVGFHIRFEELMDPYSEYFSPIVSRIRELSLIQNIIFNFFYLLIAFPYLTKSFRNKTEIKWQSIHFISQLQTAMSLILALLTVIVIFISMTKRFQMGYIFITLGLLFLNQLFNSPFFNRLENGIINLIQPLTPYILLLFISIEFSGNQSYGFTSFDNLLSTSQFEADALYIICLYLAFLLSIILEQFRKVQSLKSEIESRFQVPKNFDKLIVLQVSNQFEESFRESQERQHSNTQTCKTLIYEFFASQILSRLLIATLQIYTIIILMRNPSAFQFLSLVWLYYSSVTRNIKVIGKTLFLIQVPQIAAIINNYLSLSNFEYAILWIFIIITLMVTNLLKFMESKQHQDQRHHLESKHQSKSQALLFFFVLKNSYAATFLLIFWISLYTANVIHMVLLITIILFIIKHDGNAFEQRKYEKSFRNKYWIYLVFLVNLIIFLKYSYALGLINSNQVGFSVIELIGLQYDYKLPFSFGFNGSDFGSLSLIWILDIFVVLQYETYKSELYQEMKQIYSQILFKYQIFQLINSLFEFVYGNLLIWSCYLLSLFILLIQEINLINFIQTTLLVWVIQKHLRIYSSDLIEPGGIIKRWEIFVFIVGISTVMRYLYDFTCLKIISSQFENYKIYQSISTFQKMIGLQNGTRFFIFPKLLLDLFELILGYLGQDYLASCYPKSQDQSKISIYNKQVDPFKQEIELQELGRQQNNQLEDKLLIPIHSKIKPFDWRDIAIFKMNHKTIQQIIQFFHILLRFLLPIFIASLIIISAVQFKIGFNMLVYLFLIFRYQYITTQTERNVLAGFQINPKINQILRLWKNSSSSNSQLLKLNQLQNLVDQIHATRSDLINNEKKLLIYYTDYIVWISCVILFGTYLISTMQLVQKELELQLPQLRELGQFLGLYQNQAEASGPFLYEVYPYILLTILVSFYKLLAFTSSKHKDYSSQSNISVNYNKEFSEQRYKLTLIQFKLYQGIVGGLEIFPIICVLVLVLINHGVLSYTLFAILFLLIWFPNLQKSTLLFVIIFVLANYILILALSQMTFEEEPNKIQQILGTDSKNHHYFIGNCTLLIFLIFQQQFKHFVRVYFIKLIAKNITLSQVKSYWNSLLSLNKVFKLLLIYQGICIQFIVLLYYRKLESTSQMVEFTNLLLFLITVCVISSQITFENKIFVNSKLLAGVILIQQCLIVFIAFYKSQFLGLEAKNFQLIHQLAEIGCLYLLQISKEVIKSGEYKKQFGKFINWKKDRSQLVGIINQYESNNYLINSLIKFHFQKRELQNSVTFIHQFVKELAQGKYQKSGPMQQEKINKIQIKEQANQKNQQGWISVLNWLNDCRNKVVFMSSRRLLAQFLFYHMQIVPITEHQIFKFFWLEKSCVKESLNTLQQFYDAYCLLLFNNQIDVFQVNRQTLEDVYKQKWPKVRLSKKYKSRLELEADLGKNYYYSQKDLNFIDIVRMLIEVLVYYWDFVGFIFILYFYYLNKGLLTVFLPLIVVGLGLQLDKSYNTFFWKFILLYICLIQLMHTINDVLQLNQETNLVFLVGSNNNTFSYLIAMIITIQIQLNSWFCLNDGHIIQQETHCVAFLRFFINGKNMPRSAQMKRSFNDGLSLQDANLSLESQKIQLNYNHGYKTLRGFQESIFKFFKHQQQEVVCFGTLFSCLKVGKDLYPLIAGCQIILTVYIFCCYDLMKSVNSQLSDQIRYYHFSGEMVIAFLFHILCMFLDRYILLYRSKQRGEDLVDILQWENDQVEQVSIKLKYFYLIIYTLIVSLHFQFIICSPPNQQSEKESGNKFTFFYYSIQSLYCVLSSLQIKYGQNDLRAQSSLMTGYSLHNFILFKIYRTLPFIFEIKTLCDWAFAQTSLTLFQWIKLQEIHSLLYLAKCNSKFFQEKKVGSLIPQFNKCTLGFCFLLALVMLLFGPLLVYSPLNPTLQNDKVIGATVEIGLKINETNYYQLYINSHVSDIHQIDEKEISQFKLRELPSLTDINKDAIYVVKLSHYSDTYWDISYPSFQTIKKSLIDGESGRASNISIIQTYRFIRYLTDQTQQLTLAPYYLSNQEINQLLNSLASCENITQPEEIILKQFTFLLFRIDKEKKINIIEPSKQSNSYLQLNCMGHLQQWWSIYSDEKLSNGLKFIIVSDKYSNALFGYSLVGFYITIVYVAGKLARSIMSGNVNLVMLQDIPHPDRLIQLCEAIALSRFEKKLIEEELLYFQLIDIMRQPELLSNLTGSCYQQRLNQLRQDGIEQAP